MSETMTIPEGMHVGRMLATFPPGELTADYSDIPEEVMAREPTPEQIARVEEKLERASMLSVRLNAKHRRKVEIINRIVPRRPGLAIVRNALQHGVHVAQAAALGSQESAWRRIFGCDYGNVGNRPPWCHQFCTRRRTLRLIDGGRFGHGMNGVAYLQLTWHTFVMAAHRRGGAHRLEPNVHVGLAILASYLEEPVPDVEAYAAYNAGWTNRRSVVPTYGRSVAAWVDWWQEKLN